MNKRQRRKLEKKRAKKRAASKYKLRTYDPSKVSVSFNGVELEGFADGLFTTATPAGTVPPWANATADQILEDLQAIAASMMPDTATGADLDALGYLGGVPRIPGKPANFGCPGLGGWALDFDTGAPYSIEGRPMHPNCRCVAEPPDPVRDYVRDPVVHAFTRRPPARVLRDLALAELVLRDAIEEQSHAPDEVTDLMRIANDLRDELGAGEWSPAPVRLIEERPDRRCGLHHATYDVRDVPWRYVPPTRVRRFQRELEAEIRDVTTPYVGALMRPDTLDRIRAEIAARLRELEITNVQVAVAMAYGQLDVRYVVATDAIQSINWMFDAVV